MKSVNDNNTITMILTTLVVLSVATGILLYSMYGDTDKQPTKPEVAKSIPINTIPVKTEEVVDIPKTIETPISQAELPTIKPKKNTILSIGVDDIAKYLKVKYPSISSKNRKIIMKALTDTSKTYNINPILIFTLIETESSFRWWIKGPVIRVNKKKTRAIGLGNIVYEIWGEKLRSAGIIETKTDLFDISNNIHSIGFILSKNKEMEMLKGTKSHTESALRRYFGGNVKRYSETIKTKMNELVYFKILE